MTSFDNKKAPKGSNTASTADKNKMKKRISDMGSPGIKT